MASSSLDLYTNFFNLSQRPFALTPDPRFLYWSSLHQRAFAMLEYGILTRAPITLVTGEIGTGKTTLVFHFLNMVEADLRIGLVANAHGDRGELLHWVLLSLDQAPDSNATYVQLFSQLQTYLIDEYAKGRRVVLIFDEAQNLSEETLEELRMLTNINTGSDELLQLVLVGQPELRDVVRRPSLRQFAQRVASNVHLKAMDAEMCSAYLAHRLRVAGTEREIFTPEAARLIHKSTGGIPRLMNQLADLSMVYAYTYNMKMIGREMVQHVLDEGVFFGAQEADEPVLLLHSSAKRQAQKE